jgi:hypothetical protein
MLEAIQPQKADDPDVIRITGCACGAFTADRDWWYMEADSERTASPERFAHLSSVLRALHDAGKPAHLGRKTWSELASPEAPAEAPKPSKPSKSKKPTKAR